MQKAKKEVNGITLVALVVTIIVLLILAGIVITLSVGNKGIINRAKDTKEKHLKEEATEVIGLKITDCQISSFEEKGKLPTLAYLAAFLNNDKITTGEIEYVQEQSKPMGVLDETPYIKWEKIYTKLAKYPYEFEINDSFEIAVNGEPVESAIPTGYMKVPTETIEINENGEYNILNYANAKVNVNTDKKYTQEEYDARYNEGIEEGRKNATIATTKTLLWQNPNPNAEMDDSTLKLSESLEKYTHIIIRWKINTTSNELYDDIFKVKPYRDAINNPPYYAISLRDSYAKNYTRLFWYIDDTTLNYTAGRQVAGTASHVTNVLIPTEIYGLNFSY